MHPWLLQKAENLRCSHQISRTQSHVAQLSQVERAYVLLFFTVITNSPGFNSQGFSSLFFTLNNPFPPRTREDIIEWYRLFENMRNGKLSEMAEMHSFYKAVPEELKRHELYGLHCINVIMATLAPALTHSKIDKVKLMWKDLSSSHDELPSALKILRACVSKMDDLREYVAMKEGQGNEGRSEIAFSDEEWIERAQWIPSAFRREQLN